MYVEIHGKEIGQMKRMKPSKPWLRELETMTMTAGAFANFPNTAISFYVLVNPDGKVEKQMTGFDEGFFKTLFAELFGEK